MKITTAQLKQIIAEEIKKLTEVSQPGDPELEVFLDAIRNDWKQSRMGEAVGAAIDDLRKQILDLVLKVENDLFYEEVYSTHNAGVHGSYMKLSNGGRNKVTIEDLAQELKKDVEELREPGFFDGTGLRVINDIVSELI